MHSKAATQMINCWQAAADPKATFNSGRSNVRFLDEWVERQLPNTHGD